MTPRARLGCGLVPSVASCGVAALLAESGETRVLVVALLVLGYAVAVTDIALAVYAGVMEWVLAVAFFLGVERMADAPTVLATLMTASVAGTWCGGDEPGPEPWRFAPRQPSWG